MTRRAHTQASTAVALAWEILEGADFDVDIITVTLGTAPTTHENMTLAITGGATLATIDPVGKTEVTFKNIKGLRAGESVTVSYTNTDTVAITGTATAELYERTVKGDADESGAIETYLDGVLQLPGCSLIRGDAFKMAIKAVTFLNSTVSVALFTVTGDVIVRVLAVCKTNCASAGGCNIEVGIAGKTSTILTTTDVTLLAAGEIWHDATPDSAIEAASVRKEFAISGGADILATLSAQTDSGAVTFYCEWTALSDDANVVAA